ncbi:hypothetical protein, partial [Zoogloea sp.]|uniref:hypothetical protein n=1 Tax=Zoogloea sp. TaxID=49181 RepID=UPI0035B2A9EB
HCCAPSGNTATGGSGNFCFFLGITIPFWDYVMPQTQKFGQAPANSTRWFVLFILLNTDETEPIEIERPLNFLVAIM